MILIRQPAIAINDERDYCVTNMSINYTVRASFGREQIMQEVVRLAAGAPGGKVQDMVICCHGNPGYLILGQGFDRSHALLFRQWRGLVDKIYIRACTFARIPDPYTPMRDGNLFCSEIARNVRCTVVATSDRQDTQALSTLPYGRLDNYEGWVFWYGPDGNVQPQSGQFPDGRTNPD